MATEDMPEHVHQVVKQIKEQEEEGHRQLEHDRTICKIKVFYRGKGGVTPISKQLEIHKDKTLLEAVAVAHK